jgi:hypothetical protein
MAADARGDEIDDTIEDLRRARRSTMPAKRAAASIVHKSELSIMITMPVLLKERNVRWGGWRSDRTGTAATPGPFFTGEKIGKEQEQGFTKAMRPAA